MITLATGESDIYYKIKKTLLIRDLAVRNVFSTSHLNVSSRLTRSVYFRFTFSLSLLSLFGIILRV